MNIEKVKEQLRYMMDKIPEVAEALKKDSSNELYSVLRKKYGRPVISEVACFLHAGVNFSGLQYVSDTGVVHDTYYYDEQFINQYAEVRADQVYVLPGSEVYSDGLQYKELYDVGLISQDIAHTVYFKSEEDAKKAAALWQPYFKRRLHVNILCGFGDVILPSIEIGGIQLYM